LLLWQHESETNMSDAVEFTNAEKHVIGTRIHDSSFAPAKL